MKKILLLVILLSTAYTYSQNSRLIPFVSNSKWGYSDRKGNIIIKPVYDSVGFFNSSSVGAKYLTYAYVYQNKKMGVIDTQNKMILPTTYKYVKNVYETLHFIATNIEGKSGLVSIENQVLIPFEYDQLDEVLNFSFILKKNKKIGLADVNGKIVIPVIYDQIVFVDEDKSTNKCRWRVSNDKVTQYLFTDIYENPNNEVFQTVGNIETAENNLTSYIIDENLKDFEEKIPIRYQSNLYLLRKKNLYGFCDVKQKIGFKPKFKKIDYYFNTYDFKRGKTHYLLIEDNDKKGLIDGYGNVLLEANYETIKKEYHYLEVIRNSETGVFFLSTNKVVFSDFNKIKTAIELDNDFVIVLVQNITTNHYYYIGENGVLFKN